MRLPRLQNTRSRNDRFNFPLAPTWERIIFFNFPRPTVGEGQGEGVLVESNSHPQPHLLPSREKELKR